MIVVLLGHYGNHRVIDSKKISCSHIVLCTLLFQRLLIIKIIYWLVYNLSVGSFFFWAGTMLNNFKVFGNLLLFIALSIKFVRKWKEKLHSFRIFSGISPPAALFEDKSCTMFFTNSLETGSKENLLVIVTFDM